MQRLAALVPRPRLHIIRFHRVLAPNAGLRAAVVPGPAPKPSEHAEEHAHASARMGWARLRKRVFDIDFEHCPPCGGEFEIVAAIEVPAVIVGMLTHLGLPAGAPPRSPAQRPTNPRETRIVTEHRVIHRFSARRYRRASGYRWFEFPVRGWIRPMETYQATVCGGTAPTAARLRINLRAVSGRPSARTILPTTSRERVLAGDFAVPGGVAVTCTDSSVKGDVGLANPRHAGNGRVASIVCPVPHWSFRLALSRQRSISD